MSVRTSLRQTGAKTAIVKFEEKPLDDQNTTPSFVVKTDTAIAAVKAFIGFLFGFPPFEAPPGAAIPGATGAKPLVLRHRGQVLRQRRFAGIPGGSAAHEGRRGGINGWNPRRHRRCVAPAVSGGTATAGGTGGDERRLT